MIRLDIEGRAPVPERAVDPIIAALDTTTVLAASYVLYTITLDLLHLLGR